MIQTIRGVADVFTMHYRARVCLAAWVGLAVVASACSVGGGEPYGTLVELSGGDAACVRDLARAPVESVPRASLARMATWCAPAEHGEKADGFVVPWPL